MTASSVAPSAMTPRVSSELVPAPARTAGIAKIPVPMMLPTTSPVAEVSPSARAFCWLRGDISPCGTGVPWGFVMVDMGLPPPGGRDGLPCRELLTCTSRLGLGARPQPGT